MKHQIERDMWSDAIVTIGIAFLMAFIALKGLESALYLIPSILEWMGFI